MQYPIAALLYIATFDKTPKTPNLQEGKSPTLQGHSDFTIIQYYWKNSVLLPQVPYLQLFTEENTIYIGDTRQT